MDIEDLKTLCDYRNGCYTSKSGDEYITALSQLFPLTNRNDKPFTIHDIQTQPTKDQFRFAGVNEFQKICDLHVEPMTIVNNIRKNEKITPINFTSNLAKKIFEEKLGVVYLLTCTIDNREHIIKIGSSRTTFKQRLGSYNCGVANNWRTASTTNIKILQSMVTTRKDINLYLIDCDETKTYTWHNIESVPFALPKYLAYEDILVKAYINQFNKKPLANVQASATEV